MGNIDQETGGTFNPEMLQNGKGPAAGLFQWENYSNKSARWASLNEFATSKGKPWTDLEVQCEFALNEMNYCFKNYSERNFGRLVTLDEFKTFANVDEATRCFEKCFERAGIPNMQNRINKAIEYFNQYSNGNTSYTGGTFGSSEGISGTTGVQPTVFYNPSRIFKRIMNQYSQRTSGTFKIGEVDDSLWISSLDVVQRNETTAHYIQNTLCKFAVAPPKGMTSTELIKKMMNGDFSSVVDDAVPGFIYSTKGGTHNFKALNYTNKASDAITVHYGTQDSNVISFAVSNVGVMSMLGANTDENGNSLITASAMSDITDETVTKMSFTGTQGQEDQEVKNWYFGDYSAIKVESSMSTTGLDVEVASTWNNVQQYTCSAELQLWRRK